MYYSWWPDDDDNDDNNDDEDDEDDDDDDDDNDDDNDDDDDDDNDQVDRVVESPTELIRCPKLPSSRFTALIRKFIKFTFYF